MSGFDGAYGQRKIHCIDTGEICRAESYLNTKHWQQMRVKVYEHYQGVCQRCGDSIPFSMANVHHRTYKRQGNEKLNDLILYCNRCHLIIHKGKKETHEQNRDIGALIRKLDRQQRAEAIELIKKHFGID